MSTQADKREARLPRWAREEIDHLRAIVKDQGEEIGRLRASVVGELSRSNMRVIKRSRRAERDTLDLPTMATVEFGPEGEAVQIWWDNTRDRIQVQGPGALSIRPVAANSFTITVDD